MLSLLLPIILGALVMGYFVGKPYWRDYQRKKITMKPFNKHWRKIIHKRIPAFKKMPTDVQLQLKNHIQVFLAEKEFIGCNGVVIDDEVRVTVAAQACLLLLNRKTNYYAKLHSILIYPREFIKEQTNRSANGVEYKQRIALKGESWGFGKVVLSWEDIIFGAEQPCDGQNVVIHEFAHQLDQENGRANGAPILTATQNYATWSSTFEKEFKQLQHQANTHKPSLFDYYGATNPAEFFAVTSEVFFEQPLRFKHEHGALYQQLSRFYHVDPTLWQ